MIFIAAFGLFLLVSALANWDWYAVLRDFAIVERLLGENAAWWACGVAGLVLIVAAVIKLVP
jgi:hypothetical protein